MNSIKLDLMTVVVLFVVVGIGVTMALGLTGSDEAEATTQKAPAQTMSQVGSMSSNVVNGMSSTSDVAQHFQVSHKLSASSSINKW